MPNQLAEILKQSNGIEFCMVHDGEKIVVDWLVYPCETILEETEFFKSEYQLDGVVFADNGAGLPIYLKPNGMVICTIVHMMKKFFAEYL